MEVGKPTSIRPFLKWAGGKSQLLAQLDSYLPKSIPHYVEPFLGGGAVFFFLRSTGRLTGTVRLSDINAELINAYCAIQDDVQTVLEKLKIHRLNHSKEYYYEVRLQECKQGPVGAARMIYLNKTGYNGLYRVNRSGHFNVPFGRYVNPGIFDEENLLKISEALQGVDLSVRSYEQTIKETGRGDFIYADPPYVPLTATSDFTGYIPGGFGLKEQQALAQALREAGGRGAHFLQSNSATDTVRKLYQDFTLETVQATRMINCNGASRGKIDELIAYNY